MKVRKFRVKVIAHQLKDQTIAKAKDVVTEDLLVGNADELVRKGFVEEIEDEDDNGKKDGKHGHKPPKSETEQKDEAIAKYRAAIQAQTGLPADAAQKRKSDAAAKVRKSIEALEKLGIDPKTIDTDAKPSMNLVPKTAQEEIDGLKIQYEAAVKAHTDLPATASPKAIGDAAALVKKLQGELAEKGVQVGEPDADEEDEDAKQLKSDYADALQAENDLPADADEPTKEAAANLVKSLKEQLDEKGIEV